MDAPTLRRFLSKIYYVGGCWLWTGARANGYAKLRVGARGGGTRRVVSAHRLSYEHFFGPIPTDKPQIDHLCRNRDCVNPAHLEAVSNAENSRRGARGRLITECVHGHPYTPENTMIRPNGRRGCRVCARERMKAKRALGYIAPSRRK